jgi:hypothetical protein
MENEPHEYVVTKCTRILTKMSGLWMSGLNALPIGAVSYCARNRS